MITILARIWDYFVFSGLLGIVAAAAAVTLFVRGALRPALRTRCWWIGLALVLVAHQLGEWNANAVFRYRAERPMTQEEIDEQRRREQEEARQRAISRRRRFAEDTTADLVERATLAGEIEHRSEEEAAPAPEAPPADPRRAYREAGRQARSVEGGEARADTADTAARVVIAEYRTLAEADYHRARKYARVQLGSGRMLFWLAVILVVVDYLNRYHRTFDHLAPIPLPDVPFLGWPPDSFSIKNHRVGLAHRDPGRLGWLMRHTLAKDERFLYFGEAPLLSRTRLPRIDLAIPVPPRVFAWMQSRPPVPEPAPPGWKVWLALLPARLNAWLLSRVESDRRIHVRLLQIPHYRPRAAEAEPEFVLESAWFGRASFSLTGSADEAAGLLESITELLRRKQGSHARCRRGVTLIWDHPAELDSELLDRLAWLCRETNLRLLAVGPVAEQLSRANLLDEAA